VPDFGQYYPENEEAELFTRVIISPVYAKSLLEILKESIMQYELTFGTIKDEQGKIKLHHKNYRYLDITRG
jgi:hypothetical protein